MTHPPDRPDRSWAEAAVAAAAAARDATPHDEPIVVGAAAPLPERSDALRTVFRVDAPLTDPPPRRLQLLHPATSTRVAVDDALVWRDGDLEVQAAGLDPGVHAGGGAQLQRWVLVGMTARRAHHDRLVEQLTTLLDTPPGAAPLGAAARWLGELTAGRGTPAASGAIRLLVGSAPARRDALAAAALELVRAGRRVLLVAPPGALDQLAVIVRPHLSTAAAAAQQPTAAPQPIEAIRIGVASLADVARDPLLSPGAALDRHASAASAAMAQAAAELRTLDPGAAPPAPPPSDRALAAARAALSEASAVRIAAQRSAEDAAVAHGAARAVALRLHYGRSSERDVDELRRSALAAAAETAASAGGVGRLAAAVRAAGPADQDQLVRRLVVAAGVAVERLERRDEALAALDAGVAAVTSGAAGAALRRADVGVDATMAAHSAAQQTLWRAMQDEARAGAVVDALVRARLEPLDRAEPARTEPDAVQAPAADPAGRDAAVQRHRRAATARRAAWPAALRAARLVLATPSDALRRTVTATAPFDHVLVEQASSLPMTLLCALAALGERSTVLAADLDERPPARRERVHDRWLATPITELLDVRPDPAGGADHPVVLRLG